MKKRSVMILAAAAVAAVMLAGCMPTDKTEIQMNPDFSVAEKAELDFTDLHNEVIDLFATDELQPYTFIDSVDISGSNSDRTIYVDATAVEGVTSEDAQHFAAAMLRKLNDAAATQYAGYELSSSSSFGPLYNDYSVKIAVTGTDDASMIYQIELPAGKDIPLDPNIEKYEDEWAKAAEVYMDNVVYGAGGKVVYDPTAK